MSWIRIGHLREYFAELCGRLIDGQTNKSRCACVVTLVPAPPILPLIAINLYLASCSREISAVPPNPLPNRRTLA